MTATPRTLEQRIADWATAYDAVRQEITPDPMRKFLGAFADASDVASLRSYQDLARLVAANDRAAAMIAAMLTSGGIKPAPVEMDLGDD